MSATLSLTRPNLTEAAIEAWRPPLFRSQAGRLSRLVAACRRCVDLQAGSIWKDLSRLLPRCRGTVVDVGCGAQPYRSLLAADVNYIGIDTADAKNHFGYEMPNTRYFTGDVWPLDDASADLLLATETLEHVLDPARFLSEAFRCLRAGGQVLLTVPFAARWHFIPHDYWRYTPSCLRRLLEAAGFADVQVYARGNALTVACYKVMALILPLLMPQRLGLAALAFRLAGFACLPLLALLAAVGTLSLGGSGGNDCLGYTVVAQKRG